MPREYNKVKRTAQDFFSGISEGSSVKKVTELPEVGEENVIYELEKEIPSTKPVGLKLIKSYSYENSGFEIYYDGEIFYIDTLEHLNNISFMKTCCGDGVIIGETKSWWYFNEETQEFYEDGNDGIALSINLENKTYIDINGNTISFGEDNSWCFDLSDIKDLSNVIYTAYNCIYCVEYKENINELPSKETIIEKSKTVCGHLYSYKSETPCYVYNAYNGSNYKNFGYNSKTDEIFINWDSRDDVETAESLEEQINDTTYGFFKFQDAHIEYEHYVYTNNNWLNLKENILYCKNLKCGTYTISGNKILKLLEAHGWDNDSVFNYTGSFSLFPSNIFIGTSKKFDATIGDNIGYCKRYLFALIGRHNQYIVSYCDTSIHNLTINQTGTFKSIMQNENYVINLGCDLTVDLEVFVTKLGGSSNQKDLSFNMTKKEFEDLFE